MNERQKQTGQEFLRTLSARDFASFGVNEVVYLRPVKIQNATGWALFSADGTRLSVHHNMPEAVAVALHNDLECITLQ